MVDGNGQKNKFYHLTFDIDWAPDFAIEEVLIKLNKANIKATFFITHPSDIIADLISSGHHIGLHPNFLPSSSQGKDTFSVLEYLLNISPEATAIRTHSLVQSSPLFYEIFHNFPQLKYDLSTFMYKFPFVKSFDWEFNGVSFKRINYNWEDDAAFHDRSFSWQEVKPFSDLTVFDFHPIHIVLNSRSSDNYGLVKNELLGTPLNLVSKNTIQKHRNYNAGASDFLDLIVQSKMLSVDFAELL